MAIITKIEVQKNNKERANVYIDDKFFGGMNIELVVKYGLKKGQDINESLINEMLFEDLKSEAFNKSIKYIGSSLKSIKQMKDYLKKKEYPEEIIEFVIEKLCEYKYLDDYAYAKSFILTYSNKYGKLKLISNLKIKGVSDNIIEDVFNENTINNNIENTARKYLKNKIISNEIWVKLSRFLYSRGYEFEDINRIIEILKDEIC